MAEHPAGVLDGRLGLDRAVGDDLRDPVRAPLLGHVPDHVGAPALVEVDVDVGHGHALGVEEALEDQAVDQRVEVGDAHGVGDDGAGRGAAAGAHGDAVVLRPHDEVGDDQEVGREAHLADDPDLVLGLLAPLLVVAVRVAAVHALPHLGAEQLVLGLEAIRDGEPGHQVDGLEHAGGVDPVGDQQLAVAAALLPQVAGVQAVHLGGGLDVVAGAVEPEPVRVDQGLAGLDAQQHVLRLGVGLAGVVRVVGDDGRDAELPGRSRSGRRGPAARCPGRGPSARGSSSPCRRCPAIRPRPRGPRRTGPAAAGSAAPLTGSRWRPSARPECSAMSSLSIRGHLIIQPSA